MTAAPLTPEAATKAAAEDARLIKAALRTARGNVLAAATALQVPTRTLHRRITALGLREWLTERYPRSMRQPKR